MIEIDTRDLERVTRALAAFPSEQKKAMRNAINDTAFAILKREEREIQSSFDRPTRAVAKPFYVKKATTQKLEAAVQLKDRLQGGKIENTLKPHIPGSRPTRAFKGIEVGLRAQGKLQAGEYLVPARSFRLNQYGNITSATARKILADVQSGSGKYIWAEIRPRGRPPVRGVWDKRKLRSRQRGGNALVLVAVRRPSYDAKRFDFFRAGHDEARRVMPGLARDAIQHAWRRIARG